MVTISSINLLDRSIILVSKRYQTLRDVLNLFILKNAKCLN
jgi:hypothetical protein